MDTKSQKVHTIDPRGDLLLRVGTQRKLEDGNDDDTKIENGDKGHADEDETRCFLVCSRALSRVSPVFDRMIHGPFAEAKPEDGKDWVIELPEDNPSAMELFLNISHGHLQKAPRALSMHALYDLTALTHFYDSTPMLAPWVRPWINALHDPTSGPDDAVPKMVWISWELGHRQMFEATVRRITMEGPGSMFAEGSMLQRLQMPSDVIERICEARDETVGALLDVFRSLTGQLTVVDERPRWCRHATYMGPHRCESMILGSMTFCLTRAGLWPIPEDAGDVEHSILGLYEVLSNLVIHDIGQPVRGEGDHAGCNPRDFLMDQMKEVLTKMPTPLRESDREQLAAQAKKLHMS
ncbi:hypothetical protein B0T11DRAFT_343042 [Plectosphaerella cucumerina]|uniref:Nuclear pore protein n=1 Tax=Plectosphaerella cucumerina TaxID=40658 RepID=A0A8K0X0Q6_9PEZI|nr:hypothetical protein B0T11DRAFT_343042 [Plectosphaerella cucumerina]